MHDEEVWNHQMNEHFHVQLAKWNQTMSTVTLGYKSMTNRLYNKLKSESRSQPEALTVGPAFTEGH